MYNFVYPLFLILILQTFPCGIIFAPLLLFFEMIFTPELKQYNQTIEVGRGEKEALLLLQHNEHLM